MINKATQIIIDQGNTTTKLGFFNDRKMLGFIRVSDEEKEQANELIASFPSEIIFVSSVRSKIDLSGFHFSKDAQIIPYIRTMHIPIDIAYGTPETLGVDRIANAVAANDRFPLEQTLIIDAGTCITYTLVKEGKLMGGAISPGMQMRYKALHHFTGRLPLLTTPQDEMPAIGSTTEESLHSGVIYGIVAEIKGMITNFCSENNEFNVIITGGDGGYLGSRLKTTIFALPHLTMEGLNSIYAFNHREKIS